MYFYLLLLLSGNWLLVHSEKFHDYLNDDKVHKLFNVPRDLVPDYDIVTLSKSNIKKRSLNTDISFKAFDEHYHFNFELNESFLMGKNTALYLAGYYNRGNRKVDIYTKANYDTNIIAYHDTKNNAAVVTSRNQNGDLEVYGTLGKNTTIRPISSYLKKLGQDSILRKRSKRSIDLFENLQKSNYHIIMKHKTENKFQEKICSVEEIPNFNFTKNERHKRDVVDIVYPQLLLILDYDIYRLNNFDNNELVKYIFALYNSVDLKYRSLSQPKVRLNIASIIVAKMPGALTFLSDNQIDEKHLLSTKSLNSMSEYLFKNVYFAKLKHDIAVAMTALDIVTLEKSGNYRTDILGAAFMSSACQRNEYSKLDRSVAIVEDRGDFSSVKTIAHELGHLFGASHDSVSGNNNRCSGEYLMNPVSHIFNTNWSPCAEEQIRDYLSSSDAICLRNKPYVRDVYPKMFPGQIIKSLDDQCRKAVPDTFADVTSSDPNFPCKSLWCRWSYNDGDPVVNVGGALDGLPCKNGQGVCLENKCILKT